ncbi:MAG TPA: biotin--[acetyl-CoA-carboxylase] ligase, partial [Streptosporangiaceae bacterium]|nr:biotin--[acetyl-CoA-carboxylase] ligase [Streptosporangiaceae bacterium]
MSPIELGGAALRPDELRRAVLAPGRLWSRLDVVAETGSTNDDLLAAARAGAAEGTVLAAEHQTRGRGRQGRQWVSPTGSALIFSVLLRPVEVPPADRGWLPLLTGVAVARALREVAGVDAALKWPNDVLAGEGKLAGILAEQAGQAIVVGVGLNVAQARDELPPVGPGALPPTSLALLGGGTDRTGFDAPSRSGRPPGRTDRETLLVGILAELEDWYRRWTRPSPGDAEGSGLRAEYLQRSATIGREVRVDLPGGTALTGMAAGIDPVGRLIVDTASGPAAV